MKTRDIIEGVGKITSQNATKDVPVGGEYMNIKKLFPNQKKPMKLGEGYKLNLERDKKADMYILHIQDTKTGNRTEVRGKTGYEGKGYDPEDKLHKLLDTIGRSANVSELINGEVVTINPKHPQAPSASAATDTAFNEASNPKPPKWKRTGPDGEIEIEFPTGRRFKIEKQYDENIRHRGEWKVLEWDTRSEDWEWGDTYSPKGYAKEMVMKMGQYDSNGKQVADYSHTFQFEAINESLDNPYPYKWDKQDEDHWVAKADTPAGLMLVMFEWEQGDSSWNIDFAVNGRMGKSGKGDEFRIFATAVAVIKDWIAKVDLSNTKIISFSADKGEEVGDSRAKLYSRFAKQMASQLGWKLDIVNVDFAQADYFKLHNPNVQENFADGKINEVLDKPAAYTWSKDQFGFPTATAKELGLNIHFDGRNEPSWEVSFNRKQKDGSVVMNQPTGQGKEFQVFATVKAAILDFMNKYPDTVTLMLDARKDGGNDGEGRVSLYRRMMKQYANKLGWEYDEFDQGVMVTFEISSNPRTDENFADGKKKGKSRPGRVKRAGASCNGSVTELRKKAKNSSGERAKMYHWCANMKSGRKKSK